ncbi:response regulator receiver modulated serine phosphatase [hydrothermal vent metagenome]|uniref:Response regulator receiver modulated serine phosphatase n=1 Tax=hydrothermal vent metagenome TaxID=652676 RepID=A0A3B0XIA5_9ZZZZ
MGDFSSTKKTILVVDDDLTNRLVLCSLLKESGFLSIEAVNGEEAVQAVEDNHIDIVLLDVMMPVMDGYQAAKVIKSRQTHFIPIIFLTAMTDEDSLVKCIESGGDDFLTKPYNHVLLNSKINSMLRISGLYKNIEEKNNEISERNLSMQKEMNITSKLFDKISKNDMRGEKTGLKYSMSPMSMFNGDLILTEKNQTSGLDILVGDFTGHGLSAAVGAIPVSDVFHSMTQKCFAYTDLLKEANAKLLDLLPTQMFMACVFVSVDRTNNVLSIVNAGLPDVYLYRNNKIFRTFKSKNIPLGIIKMSPSQFEVEMETLEYGDRIYVATDGIMEAHSVSGEMFGLNRLLKAMQDNTNDDDLFDTILSEVDDFSQGAAQGDDITLLDLCHLETVEYKDDTELVSEHREANNWSMEFSLDIKSLRQFDVLPYIMQGINSLQPLESGRTSVHTVLTELFANALDHGVLKLDSSMKSTPQGYMDFYQEKQNRLESYTEGNIQITLRHELSETGKGGRLSLFLIDSGEGFDYKSPELTSKNNYSGRGMKLISSLCTEMKVMGKGNSVMAYYDWGDRLS